MNQLSSESPFSQFSQFLSKEEKKLTVDGIRVPHFVSELPEINFEKAAEFAIDAQLFIKERMPRRIQEDAETCKRIAAKKTLEYCRRKGLNLSQAMDSYRPEHENDLSQAELFEMFLERDEAHVQKLKQSERARREKRDRDILNLETDLLQRRGLQVPEFQNLLEYCGWLPEFTGHNPRYREKNWQSMVNSAEDIYLDLMGHYDRIIRAAAESFTPVEEWKVVLEGGRDNRMYWEWNLQNMGEEDISYYSVSKLHGGGTRTRPHRGRIYDGGILTHTTSLGAAQSILKDGFLHPRVCYSVDLIVLSGIDTPPVTLLFDRREMEEMYSLFPYQEPGGGHEDEVRSNEINNVGFCIGFVPATDSIFSGYEGGGAGTSSLGRDLVTQWDQRYHQEGKLWTEQEIDHFRRLAR